MSLLTIIQNAADEVGLLRPNTVIASAEQTVRTLLRHANRAGIALRDEQHPRGGWAILVQEHEFTTTASEPEYTLPTDYKKIVNDTVWDREAFWEARGPLSPEEWQVIKSGLATSPGLRRRFRIKRAAASPVLRFTIDPTPAETGETMVFEYMGKNWKTNAAGDTEGDLWSADDDVALVDEDLIELAVIWRYLRSRGLSYLTQLAEYEQEKDSRIASDGGAPTLRLARLPFFLPPGNVPDTGFG